MNIFDIVIPVGLNDTSVIEQQISYTKTNIIGYRNIYIISNINTLQIDNCIIIDEKIFPFTMDTIANIHGKSSRNSWYLQQLLKLYAGIVIPNILDKYLVIDADTYFLKPTIFYENEKCLYNYGSEYHYPYFTHMKILDETLFKFDSNKSGICHHMIFETKYLQEIFDKIENKFNKKFYIKFLESVSKENYLLSGASEYELYFNYMLIHHNDKITIRKLNWLNINTLPKNNNYDYVSIHWYMR